MKAYDTTELNIAYFAGIFDGEGSISLRDRKKAKNNVTITIEVSNTSYELVEWIALHFLGGIVHDKSRVGNRKPIYRIGWNGKHAYDTLELMLPYLIAKRERALLALQLRNEKSTEAQLMIFDEMRRLNVRGISHGKQSTEDSSTNASRSTS